MQVAENADGESFFNLFKRQESSTSGVVKVLAVGPDGTRGKMKSRCSLVLPRLQSSSHDNSSLMVMPVSNSMRQARPYQQMTKSW